MDDRRYVLIGTAGHIDHGKTALVKMLTGCETDTLKEEQERGLTIDLGFAPCELRGDLMACLVDVPGHEKFIRNMVAGASGIDAVLLVVAANDSVMPQTVEHLRIVELLGIKTGMVAVTKIDMVDEELRELVVLELKDFLEGTFLEGAPICPVSSVTGEGFEGLWIALAEMVDSCQARPTGGIFRMPVERVFSIAGYGTVITGMPPAGWLHVGDRLELLPQMERGRLRGLQVYGKTEQEGGAGQCLALNVADVDHNSVVRGNVLATPGYLEPTMMAEIRLGLLPTARPLKHQAPVRFHTGTAEVMGRIFLLDREALLPGDSAFAQFRGEEVMVVAPGDRYVIRQYSPVVTIGGGRILRPGKRKVKRFREGVVEELAALEEVLDDDPGRVEFLLRRAGTKPSRPDDIMKAAYLPKDRLAEVLAELTADGRAVAVGTGGAFLSADALTEIEGIAAGALARFHGEYPLRSGMDPTALKKELALDPVAVDAALSALEKAGRLEVGPGRIGLSGHSAEMSESEKAVAAKVLEALRAAGVSPPEVGALAAELSIAEGDLAAVLTALADRKRLVPVGDAMFAHPEAAALARSLLVDWLREHGQIGVVDYRDLLGASRKYVYVWLDHFDRRGLTYRAENLRYLKEGALEKDADS